MVKAFFDQPVKNDKVMYDNLRKIATGQGDDYSTIDLSKQQPLDADPKPIQQNNFTENPDRVGNTRIYFILEEAKETVFEFSQGTVKILWI